MSKGIQSSIKPTLTEVSIRAEIKEKLAVLESGSRREQLSRINRICICYKKLRGLDEYLYYGELLLSKATTWRDRYYIGLANFSIGDYYMQTIQWEKSILYNKKSLLIFQQGHLESPIPLANVFKNLAWSYSRLGNYAGALQDY